MPTYEYRCTTCGNDFDVVQKFSDAALTTCDECGGALRKVYNPVGVVFKGSGFYATDNRTKGKTNAATAAGDATTSDSTSDTKPSSGSDTASSTPAAPSPTAASTSASSSAPVSGN